MATKRINALNRALAGQGYCLEAGRNCIKVLSEGGDFLFRRGTVDAALAEINERIRRDNCPIDDPRRRATILAALRYWQLKLDPRTGDEYNACLDIATDGGIHEPLSAAEIDVLCESIN